MKNVELQRVESFFDFYTLHNSTTTFKEKFDKSIKNKTCKFCKGSNPDVTFRSTPHIIPELFGKNNITSNFECDRCNNKFQKYENDVATMIQHYLALLGIKSKNGVPTFQSKKTISTHSTVLKTIENKIKLNFGSNLTDFEYDEPNNKMIIRFRTKRFKPFLVYKVFLKIGISLLSDKELEKNEHYFEFLNSDKPINNGMQTWTVFRYMLKTNFFKIPKAHLYKAKQVLIDRTELPEYVLVIQFANIIYQFFLPISIENINNHKKENTLRIEMFPSFAYDDITQLSNIDIYNLNLEEENKVSITDELTFYYDKIEKGII